ncbi:MAG: hypothetical protein KKH98_05540 [Spirochaetes bacterium]|nr:hypothetical protein [Spirochaetota bacterium]
MIGLLLVFVVLPEKLQSDVTFWVTYGGLYWDVSFMDTVHGGVFSGKSYGPKSSSTYGFITQIIEIDPSKTYCMDLWVNNVNMDDAGGRFGFREDSDFYVSSFKATNSDEDYGEGYASAGSGWTNLILTNTPDTLFRSWAKVGLRVSYTSGASNLSAFFDDVRFYSLDAPTVNLIQNGDFEYGWNYPVPPSSTDNYKIYAFPKSFTPRGYDQFCSINIKVNKANSFVRVELLSLNGTEKRILYNGSLTGTTHSFLWEGTDDQGVILPMGIYILRMKVIEYDNNKPKEKIVTSLVVLGNNLR